MEPQPLTPPSPEQIGADLFTECLKTGHLPDALTVPTLIAAMDHPEQYPSLTTLLQLYNHSSKTTFTTEYYGTNIYPKDPAKKDYVNKRYQKALEQKQPRSSMLANAYSHDWETQGKPLHHFLLQIASRLNYRFDLNPPDNVNQPGDFHHLTQFLANHIPELLAYFPLPDAPRSTDTISAQIARGIGVELNQSALNHLLGELQTHLSNISLDNSRIKKGKLIDPTTNPFIRTGETSITKDFEQLFVALDTHDPESIEAILKEPDIDESGSRHLTLHANRLKLLLASLLMDTDRQSGPLSIISKAYNINVPEALTYYRQSVSDLSNPNRHQDFNSFDGQSNSTPKDFILILLNPSARLAGFGAAQFLLEAYTKFRLEPNSVSQQQADQLEILMQHFVLMFKDATTIDKIGLDSLFE